MNSLNTSQENKENKLNNTSTQENEIKEKIISILTSWKIAWMVNVENIQTFNQAMKYLKRLFDTRLLTKEEYIQIWIESWAIKIWEYLIYKWIITKKDRDFVLEIQELKWNNKSFWDTLINEKILTREKLNIALLDLWLFKIWEYLLENSTLTEKKLKEAISIQQNENSEKSLWQILVETWTISFEELDEALDFFNIKKIWEHLISKNLITYYQLNLCLNYQKVLNKPLWELLVARKFVTQIEINEVYKELWIEIKVGDLEIEKNEQEIFMEWSNEHIFIEFAK